MGDRKNRGILRVMVSDEGTGDETGSKFGKPNSSNTPRICERGKIQPRLGVSNPTSKTGVAPAKQRDVTCIVCCVVHILKRRIFGANCCEIDAL